MSQVINPTMYKAIKCVMTHSKAMPLNVGLYSKSDIEKIVYGDVKIQLLAELKIELNDLIRALTIYMREFVGNIKVSRYVIHLGLCHRDRFAAAHVIPYSFEKDAWHTGAAGFPDISCCGRFNHFIALVYKAAFFAFFKHQVGNV